MLRNYFKTALRHLTKQPGYTLLNVLGLTIGIASSLVIILYLSNELSYDKFNDKSDRIFRISSDIKEVDDAFRWASSQSPLGSKVKEEFAEVAQYVRFISNGRTKLEEGENTYYENSVYYVDSTLFDVFTFEFIAGNQATALDAPNSIVISETTAKKLFSTNDAIGKTLTVDDGEEFKITGVFKDVPYNSHIRPEILLSTDSSPRFNSDDWGNFYLFTYVLLNNKNAAPDFEQKLNKIIDENVVPIFREFGITIKYELIAVEDIHLYSDFEGEPGTSGSISYIYIFSVILIFIILIACINYMNLATARSVKRSTEVGIRKIMGAKRNMLIGQFLSESILLTIISFIISCVLVTLLIPFINSYLEIHLDLMKLASPALAPIVLLIVLITGVIGGSYPAFYLSNFAPALILKGGKNAKGGHKRFRQGLVVVQFAISIFMLVGTGVIYQQMNFVQNTDMGFDKDQVISFDLGNQEMRDKWPVLRRSLLENPNISKVSTSNSSPGNGFSKNVMNIESNEGVMEQKGLNLYVVDYDYFPTLNIDVAEGRNFSREFVTDTASAVMINQAMVKRMNWTDPIGKKIQFGTNDTLPINTVVGVVKDFHQESLYNLIEPMLFIPRLNNRIVLVKIEDNPEQTIAHIENAWAKIFPNLPFEYTFLENEFLKQYESDQLRRLLFLGFSMMTIAIACLGLLGLASFTAEQRTKEISIRKVLGASTNGLVQMLIKDFLILTILGALPAFLAAWYFMNQWLDNFVYHVSISFSIFIIVLLITMVLTMISTGYFALKAALSNPTDNLKSE